MSDGEKTLGNVVISSIGRAFVGFFMALFVFLIAGFVLMFIALIILLVWGFVDSASLEALPYGTSFYIPMGLAFFIAFVFWIRYWIEPLWIYISDKAIKSKRKELLIGIHSFAEDVKKKTKDKDLSEMVRYSASSQVEKLLTKKDSEIQTFLGDTVKEQKKILKEEKELKRKRKLAEVKRKKFEAEQRAKGLELYKGEWFTLNEIKRRKELELGLENNFRGYSAFQFEKFVAKLFSAMGYETEVTKATGDYGIDVIARKGNETVAIQAKKFEEGHNVGNRDVQRLLGSMRLRNIRATHGILITTSYFTLQAKEQAEETDVELWNKRVLHEMVRKYLIEKEVI